MDTADVSLVTYTYNDGHFVNGLLEQALTWDALPREVVVVDDGSQEPYVAPDYAVPVRVIRHDTNLGIPATKHEGISSAQSDYILAMDCDTRVVPTWLSLCLKPAAREDVGLVSGPVMYLSGEDLVSRYQRTFGDNHNLGVAGETAFVPGNAFLMRRSVWSASGGLDGFRGEVCEDHFLCNRLKGMGLILWIEQQARARQVRRINRRAMLRRYWKWCHSHVKTQALDAEDVALYLVAALALPHADRLQTAVELEEPLFIYLESLYLSYTVLDVLDHLASRGRDVSTLQTGWWSCLRERFSRYPALWAFMRSDLAGLGLTEAGREEQGDGSPWNHAFDTLAELDKSGVFSWIARAGVAIMAAEDRETVFDFSFYERTPIDSRDMRGE